MFKNKLSKERKYIAMSEDTNTATAIDFSKLEFQRDAVQNERFYEVRDGKIRLVETQITRDKSEYKGFSFFKLEFKDVGEALTQLGDETLLDLVNAKLASQIGIRVTARIESEIPERNLGDERANPPVPAETVEAYAIRRKAALNELLLKRPVIFTAEDAFGYQPGERELTMSGLTRKIGKVMQAGLDCYKAGKVSEGAALFAQVAELNSRFNKMMEDARNKALESVGETE